MKPKNTSTLKSLILLCVIVLCFFSCKKSESNHQKETDIDVLSFVDPFIGTGFHGHTFPGPVLPNGMVQLSPDTKLNGWDASSGYHYSDSTIYGFSHTHLSGTGIGDMGDVLVLPFTGNPTEKPIATFNKKNEHAEVGYYSVSFDNFKVKTELTTTKRVGFHKYTFDKDAEKQLLFDLGHILQETWGHSNVFNDIEFIDDTTIRGLKHSKGWANSHKVYFYAKFSSPYTIDEIVVDDLEADTNEKKHQGKNLYSYLSFDALTDNKPLLVKVSISAVDVEGAQKNMEAELAHWDFETVKTEAKNAWKKELKRIKVSSKDTTQLTNFYTGLYHTMIAPMLYQDVDGRYRGMDKQTHHSENTNYTVYSLWDTFRALHPLMTIIDEPKSIDYVNNLMLKYKEGGLLPKWPLANNYTGTMVGYPAVSVIADAMSKNLPNVDTALALEASITSASYRPDLVKPTDEPRKQRVMTLHNKYINEGKHIPSDKIVKSVSYGLENAYYDWCIAQIAKWNNNDSIANIFEKRALNYQLYFDAEVGFMRGKNEDGTWVSPFNPRFVNHQGADFVEGNSWQWTWFVPHDIEGLINLYGDKDAFTSKLDGLFTASSKMEGEHVSGDLTGLIGQYAHGNEPSHHIAYLYTHAGKSWKTQELVDQILKKFYTTQPDGIIGNEDCGQMSAWYIMNAMGFYQVTPGNPVYTIGRPLFGKVEIPLANGKTFTIVTENNSNENKYVQNVMLNGKKLDALFFTHDDIKNGSTLTITMGSEPRK
jgi:predicted alpha-1,2-mannosidase